MMLVSSSNNSTYGALQEVFAQLQETVLSLGEEWYSKSLNVLNQQTIGKHVRHILENFELLALGVSSGSVNYDSRKRNTDYETNNQLAMNVLQEIISKFESIENKEILVQHYLWHGSDEIQNASSTVEREIFYNIEHMVHHMAIIKIAIEVENIPAMVSDNFGVASSTVKFAQISS